MKRRLVLSSEGAGHPFRRTLPPHVLRGEADKKPGGHLLAREDTHLFLISFAAFFTIFYTFLS